MAEDQAGADDKTEEATPERRDEYRERGQIAISRELSSVLSLGACAVFISFSGAYLFEQLRRLFITSFQSLSNPQVNPGGFLNVVEKQWIGMLQTILPLFFTVAAVSAMATLLQTGANFSFQKLTPKFSRMNILQGLARMVNTQAAVELTKGIAKMAVVGLVAFLILKSEWPMVPRLMEFSIGNAWSHWLQITMSLMWATTGILLVIAGFDYLYNFITFERQMRMSKQEIKEENKRREVDPHVKARMKRMQREIVNKKMVEKTKGATLLITNPTHYAVAIKYEIGMAAPVVVAKGIDFLALRMREVAKELGIPVIENKPLARTLYKIVDAGMEIPESLYKAVSEVIRYVFGLRGIKIPRSRKSSIPVEA